VTILLSEKAGGAPTLKRAEIQFFSRKVIHRLCTVYDDPPGPWKV